MAAPTEWAFTLTFSLLRVFMVLPALLDIWVAHPLLVMKRPQEHIVRVVRKDWGANEQAVKAHSKISHIAFLSWQALLLI